jgi:hypothetical protein
MQLRLRSCGDDEEDSTTLRTGRLAVVANANGLHLTTIRNTSPFTYRLYRTALAWNQSIKPWSCQILEAEYVEAVVRGTVKYGARPVVRRSPLLRTGAQTQRFTGNLSGPLIGRSLTITRARLGATYGTRKVHTRVDVIGKADFRGPSW